MRASVNYGLALALSLTACSKSDEDLGVKSAEALSPQQSGSLMVQANDAASAAIAPPPNSPATPPGATSVASTGTGSKDEFNGDVVTRDDDGNRLNGEALLKKAMMQHVEGKGHPYPTRIEELVELGTLKSLPPAPAGQKWAIDPNTRQIILQ